MKTLRLAVALLLVGAVAGTMTPAPVADAQAQTIKIGILYDHSGPFSAAGSLNCYRGAKMIIDYVNEKGGVLGKYKIVQVDGDSQSKTEAAINE
ncbi:MAG: ABC transporter substrate-binding protein, partial [Candidatus Rokubacteria bacterium]|nr:ABC transporter substrate-binding protein [Candidatus Rokubacteria bacterium]